MGSECLNGDIRVGGPGPDLNLVHQYPCMAIERSESEGKITWELSDGDVDVEIQVLDYDPVEMRLWSEDVHLVELAEDEAEGWNPSPEEFIEAVEDGLDLVLDSVEIEDAAAYEASFTLTDASIVIAGERWGGPRELYPG